MFPVPAASPRDGRALGLLGAALAVVLALFAAAIVFRQGGHEYDYRGDRFFFVRRLGLGVAGIIGLCVWEGRWPWRLRPRGAGAMNRGWLEVCLGYGLLVGMLSPLQRVRGGAGLVCALTLLHVVCEELFFRAALTPVLKDAIGDRRLAILVSGIAYGAYHCTYYSFWIEAGWQPRLYYVGLIAAFAGVPLAWMQLHARTWLAPLLCHGTLQLAMMAHSLARR